MILYFSSTGNCKFIAEALAAELNDTAASILATEKIQLSTGEKLGFVFPTYFWRLPSLVDEYMETVTITAGDAAPYIYFIATCGATCGQTGTYMKRHLKKKGFRLSAAFTIKTVDNWTIGFDVNDKENIRTALEQEKHQTSAVLAQIKVGATGNQMKHTLPMIAVCGSNFFYKKARKTKHLHAEGGCIGCGLCAGECPTAAIEMKDGKPIWVKEECTLCLHCLHICPKFAIHYDNKTQNHGQYRHP